MFHYVYEITNLINNKKYIGKRSCHCSIENDKYMGSGKILSEAKKKYGIENFSKKILKVCKTEQEAYVAEIAEISSVNADTDLNYYNIQKGGEGVSSEFMKIKWNDENYRKLHNEKLKRLWTNEDYRSKMISMLKNRVHSEETKEKIRKANSNPSEKTRKLRSENSKGENNPMYGKHHSEKHKAMLSERFKGENNPMYGRKFSIEHIRKIKNNRRSFDNENNPMYGKTHTLESKSKISNSRKGKCMSCDNHASKKSYLYK